MDHSIYGYLCRRSTEELNRIIAMCQANLEDSYYAEILAIAENILASRVSAHP